MNHRYSPNDFVKSTLDGFKVGLVVRYAAVSTYSVPGYIIRLAAGKETWIAEEDLKLIAPAIPETDAPLSPADCPTEGCTGMIIADGAVQRLPHRSIELDQFTCNCCGSTFWRNPRPMVEGGAK